MRRTDRLFELLQLFRGGRLRRGEDLAAKLGVALRTIYRDIDTLISSGIPIEAERGVGYILRQPIFLPPLTLTISELEVLNLGIAMVRRAGDEKLIAAAESLGSKIESVLPNSMPRHGKNTALKVLAPDLKKSLQWMSILHDAIKSQNVVKLTYQSLSNQKSERRIRPLQLEFWGNAWTCTAWCELRESFRVFRLDHIETCLALSDVFKTEPDKTIERYVAQARGQLRLQTIARAEDPNHNA